MHLIHQSNVISINLPAMITTILTVATAIVLLFLLYTYWYQNYSWIFKNINKIPGPPGHSILGHLLLFMESQEKTFLSDRQMALEYFPIFKRTLMNIATVSLMLPEDVELVLSSMKYIKKSILYNLMRPWLGSGLLTSDGAKWQTRRKLLTPAFHFNILQGFLEIFNKETNKLVKTLRKIINEPVDVVPIITQVTLNALTETSMGIKLGAKNDKSRSYRKAIYEFGEYFTYRVARPWLAPSFLFYLTPTGKLFNKVIDTLHRFTESVIAEKKKISEKTVSYASGKKLAMLDLLLAAQANGADIDDEGIREEVDTFMFEGHDTTSVAICFVLMVLANNKKVQEEVYQEIVEVLGDSDTPSFYQLQELCFLERCLKECLRLYPSVHIIARQLEEDLLTTTGYLIPKGTMVHVRIFDIHHNPNLYPDPEKFDPDRFLPENIKTRHAFAYVPFSAGPRNCIGQRYALMELKSVLCGILRSFVLEPVDKPEDLVFITDLVLRSKNGVKVKFVPRSK